MRRYYRLHELEDAEFEDLVCRICMRILGMGTISFSTGKDGGRDARFDGTATNFPSSTKPAKGKFVIQAKHTSNPLASCSHPSFTKIFDEELPKIEKLAKDGDLQLYLLFTNRVVTGGTEKKLVKQLKSVRGVKDAWVLGDDPIRQRLDFDPTIWESMGFDKYDLPFRFQPRDINEVVIGFHNTMTDITSPFKSAANFDFVAKEEKNKINGLSKKYYEYMLQTSLPHFTKIKGFLEDPRNVDVKTFYHDAADELRQKIVTFRNRFHNFDEVLTHIHDLIVAGNAQLIGKKRLVNIFLHYMYFDCDIGDHAETN